VLQDFETQEQRLFDLFSSADSSALCVSCILYTSSLSLPLTSKIQVDDHSGIQCSPSMLSPGISQRRARRLGGRLQLWSERLIHILIFAGIHTQKSRGRHCNKKKPGLFKNLEVDIHEDITKTSWETIVFYYL
jgi:hypothetical protein